MATFTVIIPTVGRETLRNTLASVASQIRCGDEICVLCNRDGDFGNRARNAMIEQANGTHLVFLDDDDEWMPGALDAMRRFADEHPGRVGIFRAYYDLSGPTDPVTDIRSTATVMYVVPNMPGKVGRFEPTSLPGVDPLQFSDYEFIRSTLELQQTEPIFQDEVVTRIRPERSRWRRLRFRMRLRQRLRLS